jgi:phosphohistidine phosphatase
MKTVLFIRHAKSSWKSFDLKDIERPLNKRGLRDAPFMGEKLAHRQIFPDLMISSDAVRAYTTAQIIATKLNYPIQNIQQKHEIYEATPETVLNVLRQVADDKNVVFIFGHNPTFTMIANHFSDDKIENVPTCGILAVNFEMQSWKELNQQNSHFSFFDFPKNYL